MRSCSLRVRFWFGCFGSAGKKIAKRIAGRSSFTHCLFQVFNDQLPLTSIELFGKLAIPVPLEYFDNLMQLVDFRAQTSSLEGHIDENFP